MRRKAIRVFDPQVAIKVKETTGNDQRVCAGSESHSMAGGVAMRYVA